MLGGTAIAHLLGEAFDVIDGLFTSDEEREAAKLKVLQAEMAGRLKELELSMSAIVAEAQSKDPWTSRARPTFLYLIYVMILMCVAGAILGIWWPDRVTTAAQNLTNLLGAIPDSLWWLFGAGYLGYTGARSFDKWRGNNGK